MEKKINLSNVSLIRLFFRSLIANFQVYLFILLIKNIFRLPKHITNSSTDIIIEGYPRSGNSYLFLLLKQIKPKINISSHSHSVANVKRGLLLEKKIIILIRSPVEAVTSRMIFQKNLNPILALFDYYLFYSFVKKFKKKFLIIDSKKMFKNDRYTLIKLNNVIKFDLNKININKDKIFSDLKNENNKVSSALETLGYPSTKKNNLKKIYKQKILKSSFCSNLLKKNQGLYEELRNL